MRVLNWNALPFEQKMYHYSKGIHHIKSQERKYQYFIAIVFQIFLEKQLKKELEDYQF